MVRRNFLAVAASALAAAGRADYEAREIVRGGELGEVSFCRVVGERQRMLEFVQHAFGESGPVSVTEMGTRATVRYAHCIASYDGMGEDGVWFYGSEGTMRVDDSGLRIWSADGRSRRI